jgi:hypothetical protein
MVKRIGCGPLWRPRRQMLVTVETVDVGREAASVDNR